MVRISSALLVLPFIFGSLASPLLRRTVAQVESDITGISTQVDALNTAIQAFPTSGGNLVDALGIHTDATNLASAVTTATSDTQATDAFSEDDGQTILAQVQALEPNIITTLQNLIAKKSGFTSLPVGGVTTLVEQDLQTLANDTSAFADALIAKSPADLVDQANTIKSDINAAFSSAISAYS
ncbi:hypothetical protein HETIRDRAFT_27192, partial [Heterobasidion irregulare TC 32-1]